MMNIMHFYEAGKSRSGTALIPFLNATTVRLFISTRTQNIEVDWGDGSSKQIYNTSKNSETPTDITHDYSSAFTGNVTLKIIGGKSNVYSFNTSNGETGAMSKLNITDIEAFFNQFPNLYSVFISEFLGSTTVIKGDLSRFPDSVEKVLIQYTAVVNSVNDFVLNLSNYRSSSKLKSFKTIRNDSPVKLLGDLSKLPTACNLFNILAAHPGSAITYTAGRTWASSFDSLYLPIALTPTETDSLFIDLDNSVTTAIGSKLISVKGYRTFASDAAVASLRAKGFTIICLREKTILDLPLQNNFTDYSVSPISIVAGSGTGLPSFVSDGSGGYAVDIASGKFIKTNTNLPVTTVNKITILFDIKTTQTAQAEIIGNVVGNFFFIRSNYLVANKLGVADNISLSSFNIVHSVSNINSGSWINVRVEIDRNLGKDQNSIYINGVLSFTQNPSYHNDFSGNFGAYPLIIGSSSTIMQMKNVKILIYENL